MQRRNSIHALPEPVEGWRTLECRLEAGCTFAHD